MPTYRVEWKETITCWATVDADSPEDAVEKAKRGEYNDDCDSDPGDKLLKTFKCSGLA